MPAATRERGRLARTLFLQEGFHPAQAIENQDNPTVCEIADYNESMENRRGAKALMLT